MRIRLFFSSLFLLGAAFVIAVGLSAQQTTGSASAREVTRGEYLVRDVAMCWQCHTPRHEDGSTDESRWLLGGPVVIEPMRAVENWADVAPRIAGLPPGTDQQFITLMTKGIARTGKPPRPPMPQFHLTRQDAKAVLAYLKSLRPRG
ncbi:MAG TPA: cytochrome c [Vicinamibacterales bacterium]|nr:cytochrome c [Vicinamibacterales bacterium]